MDIENQNTSTELKPGELGGMFVIISTMTMSFICGFIYVIDEMEGNFIWRPHRAIQGFVLMFCICAFIFVPLGGIVEVYFTNKGTFRTGIKNSILGACNILCICC